jgi:hypothetical protein
LRLIVVAWTGPYKAGVVAGYAEALIIWRFSRVSKGVRTLGE